MPYRSKADIEAALAATVLCNLHQMRCTPVPRLYESGVRYQREHCLAVNVPETCERFLTALQLLAERVGDCDDLASFRCAELIHTGEDTGATARAVRTQSGWHAIVRRGNGMIEDPSAKLGMRGRCNFQGV
jgi:hypothetical protein